MAYEQPGFVYTDQWDGVAAAIPQFSAVVTGATTIAVPGAAGAGTAIDGIVQMPCAQGRAEPVRIMKSGISFAIAGVGNVAKGNALAVAADGTLVVAGVNDVVIGKCMSTAAAGELFSVLLS